MKVEITVPLEVNRHAVCIWASLVVQVVKNPPAMQETLVQFLGWEITLEKGQATHTSILGFPWWLRWKASACDAGDLA